MTAMRDLPPYVALRQRPWEIFPSDESIFLVEGMIGRSERKLLLYLSQEYFAGRGAIIDAGSLVGASTLALATGVSRNLRPVDARCIHSYDQFMVDADYLRDFLTKFYGAKQIGDTFFDVFQNNLKEHMRHLSVHRGNFLDETWNGGPVEVLFIDICKDRALNSAVIKQFFGSMMPGISVVVHQDYHHPHLPWIHVTMESLSAYFEVVAEMVDHSMVFCLKEPLPCEEVDRCVAYSFVADEQISLMERAISRLEPKNRANVSLAKVVLLYQLRGREAAQKELDIVTRQYADSSMILWSQYVDEVKARLR
jgi:hypothetical protein